MATFITLFTILIVPKYLLAEDCPVNLVPVEDAWDKKLHKDLWAHYDHHQPPINQSCVPTSVSIYLKSFTLDEFEGIYSAKVWTRLQWTDERLAWNPEDYGGVAKVIKHSLGLWIPSFKLIRGVYPPYLYDFFSDCSVTNKGKVLCVGQIVYDTFCSSKLRDWPYDVQNCTLEFGDDDVFTVAKYEFPDRPMSMFGAEYGPGWNIMDAQFKKNVSETVLLSISVTLERQANGLVVILIVPCIILTLLTLTTTFLSPKGYVRLGFSCFCLISHFIFTSAIDEFLPKHSVDTPVILLFAQGSTIVAVICVLLTQTLRAMVEITTAPATWIVLITDKVTDGFGNYLLFPKFSKIDTEDVDVKNKDIWLVFANILNSNFMVIIVVIYICLFIIYMPKQPPFEYKSVSWN